MKNFTITALFIFANLIYAQGVFRISNNVSKLNPKQTAIDADNLYFIHDVNKISSHNSNALNAPVQLSILPVDSILDVYSTPQNLFYTGRIADSIGVYTISKTNSVNKLVYTLGTNQTLYKEIFTVADTNYMVIKNVGVASNSIQIYKATVSDLLFTLATEFEISQGITDLDIKVHKGNTKLYVVQKGSPESEIYTYNFLDKDTTMSNVNYVLYNSTVYKDSLVFYNSQSADLYFSDGKNHALKQNVPFNAISFFSKIVNLYTIQGQLHLEAIWGGCNKDHYLYDTTSHMFVQTISTYSDPNDYYTTSFSLGKSQFILSTQKSTHGGTSSYFSYFTDLALKSGSMGNIPGYVANINLLNAGLSADDNLFSSFKISSYSAAANISQSTIITTQNIITFDSKNKVKKEYVCDVSGFSCADTAVFVNGINNEYYFQMGNELWIISEVLSNVNDVKESSSLYFMEDNKMKFHTRMSGTLVSLSGTELLTFIDQSEIDLTPLNKGIYIVKFDTGQAIKFLK